MEQRARDAGFPISRSQISNYEHGSVERQPTEPIARGLAAALGCTFEEVAAAASESFGFDVARSGERRESQRAEAWLRLTEGRSDAEVEELLAAVEAILRMRDL